MQLFAKYRKTIIRGESDDLGMAIGTHKMFKGNSFFIAEGPLHQNIEPGVELALDGEWVKKEVHEYDRVFLFDSAVTARPWDKKTIIAFLRTAPRIGRKFANKLWEMYGTRAIDKFIETPEEFSEEIGIIFTKKMAREAARYLQEHYEVAQKVVPLETLISGANMPANLLELIEEAGWDDPVTVIEQNPYSLMSLGIGYWKCETLRKMLGLPKIMPERYQAAAISSARSIYSAWVSRTKAVNNLLNRTDLNRKEAEQLIYELANQGKIAQWKSFKFGRDCVGPIQETQMEQELAEEINDHPNISFIWSSYPAKEGEIVIDRNNVYQILEAKPGLLGWKFPEKKLQAKQVVINDLHLFTNTLFYHLLKTIPPDSVITCVGDKNALPPSGIGNITWDIQQTDLPQMDSLYAATEVDEFCQSIMNGDLPDIDEKGKIRLYIRLNNDDIRSEVRKAYHKFGKRHAQIILPVEEIGGDMGSAGINKMIQKTNIDKYRANRFFRPKDKVVCTKDIMVDGNMINEGEIGFIRRAKKFKVIVVFERIKKAVTINIGKGRGPLSLAYCLTPGLAQMNRWPTVIVVLPSTSRVQRHLNRRRLYAACRCATERIIIVGAKFVLKPGLKKTSVPDDRASFLSEWIKEGTKVG